MGGGRTQPILGGRWDSVTTYNWGYNPTHNSYNEGNPYEPNEGNYKTCVGFKVQVLGFGGNLLVLCTLGSGGGLGC